MARIGKAGESLAKREDDLKGYFSEQFDYCFSYRLMEALRNVTQHNGAAIGQTLTMIRTVYSKSGDPLRVLTVSPQIMRETLIDNKKVRPSTRKEVAAKCGEVIDLMPHVAEYARCFGTIVVKTRLLYDGELKTALRFHEELLGSGIKRQRGSCTITDTARTARQQTVFISGYELRRIERIRLRNYARDPN